jgi:AmiR/NasT family two-component response regulator
MVLTGRAEADAINAAHDLGAHYVVKPVDQARIVRFVVDACKPQAARDGLDAIVARYVLSPAESDILRAQE